MPKIILPNPGTKESFSRPVVKEVVKQLIEWTGFPKNIRIQMPGDAEVMHQQGSSVDQQEGHNTYDETSRLFVTYEDDFEETYANEKVSFVPDQRNYFFDPTARVFMRPSYSRVKIVITIKYQATDKGAAEKWRNEFKTRFGHGREDRYHDLSYSYLIPKESLVILKEIHRLRENKHGYGEDYDTYFKKYLLKEGTKLTDQAGKNFEWAIRETQTRCNGYLDVDGIPDKPSRTHDGTSFSIEFDYVLTIDKPIATLMFYELMVHNQALSKRFVDTTPPDKMENHLLSFSVSNYLRYISETYDNPQYVTESGFSAPLYDEFVPSFVFPHTLRLLTCLVGVDEQDKKSLINLGEPGAYRFSESVLRYMRRNHQKLNEYSARMINVVVYEFGIPLSPEMFSVDADLNVRLTNESNMRKIYHVRVSIFTNPMMLPPVAITDLCEDYTGTYEMMNHIAPKCIEKFPLKKLGTNSVSKSSLMDVIRCRYQRAMKFATENDPIYRMLTQSLVVVAHANRGN